jgi:hypothetical protein
MESNQEEVLLRKQLLQLQLSPLEAFFPHSAQKVMAASLAPMRS